MSDYFERGCEMIVTTMGGQLIEPTCNACSTPEDCVRRPIGESEEEKVNLWMRLGVSLKLTKEQARKILKGNELAFMSVLKDLSAWRLDGDSYVPYELPENEEVIEALGLHLDDLRDMILNSEAEALFDENN